MSTDPPFCTPISNMVTFRPRRCARWRVYGAKYCHHLKAFWPRRRVRNQRWNHVSSRGTSAHGIGSEDTAAAAPVFNAPVICGAAGGGLVTGQGCARGECSNERRRAATLARDECSYGTPRQALTALTVECGMSTGLIGGMMKVIIVAPSRAPTPRCVSRSSREARTPDITRSNSFSRMVT